MTAGCPCGRQGFGPKQLSCVQLGSADSMFKSVKTPTQRRFPVHIFFFSKKCKRCCLSVPNLVRGASLVLHCAPVGAWSFASGLLFLECSRVCGGGEGACGASGRIWHPQMPSSSS